MVRSSVRASQDGYSLAEMLVVVAIIAVMAAIVIPQLAFQQKGSGLKSAATELMSSLRAARRMAIAERELRALAIDLYSIPGEFTIMRPRNSNDPPAPLWIAVGESHQLPNNIAIVAVTSRTWTTLDITRTDDVNLNGAEDPLVTSATIFNPELDAAGNPNPSTNGIVNSIYRLVKFYPTGTADEAMIYLWNTTEERRDIPNPSMNLSLSNIPALGVPPGLDINALNNQQAFYSVPSENSEFDVYYYTLVVNPLTGSVEIYDYAWGYGNPQWNRRKDGQ